jgi:hypothetical protein
MEIDHVLPESLLTDPEGLAEARERLGIDANFRIAHFENLAPSCHTCNRKKGDLILADGMLGIHFARIRQHLPALVGAIEKRRNERDLEVTLRFIMGAIDGGKYTAEQLIAGLRGLEQFSGRVLGQRWSALPASPEIYGHGVIADTSRIVWTSHAISQMEEHGVTTAEITRIIVASARNEKLRLATQEGGYVLRAPDDIEIVFEPLENALRIVSVFSAGGAEIG